MQLHTYFYKDNAEGLLWLEWNFIFQVPDLRVFAKCVTAGSISASVHLWCQSNTYIPQLTRFLVPLGQTLRKKIQFNVYAIFFLLNRREIYHAHDFIGSTNERKWDIWRVYLRMVVGSTGWENCRIFNVWYLHSVSTTIGRTKSEVLFVISHSLVPHRYLS